MPKVLVIEDEAQMNEVIYSFLEKRGFEVKRAFSGREALDIYSKENPEIVFLDLGLPDMEGKDILRKIKEESPQTKVIVISGYDERKEESLNLGADYFLSKPVLISTIYDAIKNILGKEIH